MIRRTTSLLILLVLSSVSAGAVRAQVVEPPFDEDYTLVDLGLAANVPLRYGGIAFDPSDPDVLWVGGRANFADAGVYSVPVLRDAAGFVTGFGSPEQLRVTVPSLDGGVDFRDGVLFVTKGTNEIAQVVVDDTATRRDVDLVPLGVAPSPGGLSFVPEGFPSAGALKALSWSGGEWYTLAYEPDGAGLFSILSASHGTTLPGGTEGFRYLPPGHR